jgi:hypothetical protein
MAQLRTGTIGGQPLTGPPSRRVPCPDCDAPAGARCVVWKKYRGERLYVERGKVNSHRARAAAARAAGEPLPAGRTPRAAS